jgi:hypothetical protein
MSAKTEYLELQRRMKDLRAQMKIEAEAMLKEEAIKIFEKYPQLESIAWQQYTPYFNDGDPCRFHANTDEMMVNGEWIWDWPETKENEWVGPAHAMASELIGALSYEELEDLFGDHAEVYMTRDGFEVSGCDHD